MMEEIVKLILEYFATLAIGSLMICGIVIWINKTEKKAKVALGQISETEANK